MPAEATPRVARPMGSADRSQRMVPHVAGTTLTADAFLEPSQLVGISYQHHPINVYSHRHDYFELAIVASGTGRHLMATGEQEIRRGSAIFVPPRVAHGYRLCDDMYVYNCLIRAEVVNFELRWASLDPGLMALFGTREATVTPFPVVLTLGSHETDECLEHLEHLRTRRSEDRTAASDLGHLLLAIDIVARRLDTLASTGERATVPHAVSAAVDVIEHDLSYPWTLSELSARAYVGPQYLCHMFTQWLGRPPIAFVNHRRAEVAAQMLVASDVAVAAVGAAVGWPDPSAFSRAFRRAFGQSPLAYRHAHDRGPSATGQVAAAVHSPDARGR